MNPAWRGIAARVKVRPSEVASIYAALYEHASAHAERGSVLGFPHDDAAAFFDLSTRQVRSILKELQGRGFIVHNHIAAWEEQQERPVKDNSTDRVRRHREKNRSDSQIIAALGRVVDNRAPAAAAEEPANLRECNGDETVEPLQCNEEIEIESESKIESSSSKIGVISVAARARPSFDSGSRSGVNGFQPISVVAGGTPRYSSTSSPENRKARWEQNVIEYAFRTLPSSKAQQVITGYMNGEPSAKADFDRLSKSMQAEKKPRRAA